MSDSEKMLKKRKLLPILCFYLLSADFLLSEVSAKELQELPLVFSEDFESGADRWQPLDPNAWMVVDENGNHVYSQFVQSTYEPPVRSPYNISLVKDLSVSDFVWTVKAKQTSRQYEHRDLCFIFGWIDASHFYYAHIAPAADDYANSIFIVNGEPRVSIALERTAGTAWVDGKYHDVRIERNAGKGTIEVFFDNAPNPIMRAVDSHFTAGRLGLGSFDDTGNFDDIRVWGKIENAGVEDWELYP
ncbi:MAG: hypothetical protein AB1656_18910 [Candidatus Omnitrophota bacterium]